MDLAADNLSDGGGERRQRPRPEESGEELVVGKKARCGGTEGMRRVAEIVLVLSGLGRMRGGGKSPTKAEVELMEEARAKLAEMCEEFMPRDVVGRDAIGAVVEDLGLNGKGKGFNGSKLSISEKLLLSKRKMEESKKFAAPSATYTSNPSPTSFGSAIENRGTSHTVRTFPSDRPSHAPMSSGGFPVSSPPVHVPATTSTSLSYQLPTSEVRVSTGSSGLPGGHLGREPSSLALPRVERPQHKVEGGSNGSHAPQVQVSANSSANHPLVNAPTWSVQPQPASSVKAVSENRVPSHKPVMVEGSADLSVSRMASQASRDQNFRPFITQTASGNLPSTHQPLQGMNFVQASSFGNNNNEIAKIVQRVLQPQLPEHPTWTPPSREYMNKALTCQTCRATINDVESVLLCDACEKGFHLICIPNSKGIPRVAEWHCIRCMSLSHGKPLPPKYGRVMRSTNPPKVPSNTTGVQSHFDKKVGPLDPKVNQQKITSNGSSGFQSPVGSGTVGSNCVELASNSNILNASIMQGNNLSPSRKDGEQRTSSGTCADKSPKSLGLGCGSPSVGLSSERSAQLTQISELSTVSESKLQPPAVLSGAVSNKSKQGERDVAQASPVESSGPITEATKLSLSDGLHSVEWIGDVVQVVDEKKFYQSCCIDGVTYKVQDHALFCSSHDKLMPSKLKAMWEDSKTGSKWVIFNRCYFPGDLPESVVHPCTPEINEVYESNNDSIVVAGLIQGPCEVLPPAKFKEVSERRSQLGTESNQASLPVFVCKWFYDESKQKFQPVSS